MNFQPAMLVNSGVYLQWIFQKTHPEVFAPRRHMTLISNLSKAFRFPNDPNTTPNLSEFHGVSRFVADPNKFYYSFEARFGSVPVIRKSDGFLVCVCLASRDSIHLFSGKKMPNIFQGHLHALVGRRRRDLCGFFCLYLDLTSKCVKFVPFFHHKKLPTK